MDNSAVASTADHDHHIGGNQKIGRLNYDWNHEESFGACVGDQ